MEALSEFCMEKFGGMLHVITKKLEPKAKADMFVEQITGPINMSGKSWEVK